MEQIYGFSLNNQENTRRGDGFTTSQLAYSQIGAVSEI